MFVNEQQFATRVIAALDERGIPAHIANRLMAARVRALAAAATASPAGRNTLALYRPGFAGLAGTLLLVLATGVWYATTIPVSGPDYIEIDTAVLSGDLPVQAYLDRGFDAYVRQGLSTD